MISDVRHTTAERESQGSAERDRPWRARLGDVYVEIGPQDADYSRFAEHALTPEEAEQRRNR